MNTCIRQRTLKNVIRATGLGLHTGAQVHLTLRPAPPDHGIVFVRTDLAPPVRLPARAERVGDTSLVTTLTSGATRLSTVEHLLATFAGLGIDNAVVEVDAPELPIMDGSAGPFVFLVQSAGIATQDAPRRYLRVRKPVLVRDGEAWAELSPHEGFRLEYTFEFDHPTVRRQRKSACFELTPTAFVREISRARTFGFLSGCDRANGMKPANDGGPGENVDLDDHRNVADEGMRLGDELVRHKILDAIGDLFLVGHGMIGAFTGFRSGHGTNRALLQKLLGDPEAWEVVTFGDHAELAGAFGRQPLESIAETA